MSDVGGDATRQIAHIKPLSVDEILAEVAGIIARYLPDARIFLFGSRAKGCAGETSDFDIAIDGNYSGTQNHYHGTSLCRDHRDTGHTVTKQGI